jgi:hypothetical protein
MPNVLIAQGEDDARRLRVQLIQPQPQAVPQTQVPQTQTQVSKPAPRPPPRPETQVSKPGPRPVQSEAFAIPHPEYPDTYELVIDGVKKGFAAVQDLDLSKRLKLCGDKIRVKIEWNAEFSMYEINDTY